MADRLCTKFRNSKVLLSFIKFELFHLKQYRKKINILSFIILERVKFVRADSEGVPKLVVLTVLF